MRFPKLGPWFAFVVGIACVEEARAQPGAALPKLTLRMADDLALRRHPSLRVFAESTEVERTLIGVEESAWYPRLFFGAQWIGGSINGNPTAVVRSAFPDLARVPGTRVNPNAHELALWGSSTVALSTRFRIYDFGVTKGRIDEAKARVRQGEAAERTQRDRVLIAVRQSYFAALAAESAVDAVRQSLSRIRAYYQQAEALVRQGLRRPIDAVRMRAEVARVEVLLVSAQNEVTVARVHLDNALGARTAGHFALVVDSSMESLGGKLDEFLATAFRSRPELVEYQHRAGALEARAASLRGNYWPTLAGTAGIAYRNLGGVGNWVNFDAGVMLIWPIFEGFITKRQQEENGATLRALAAELAEFKQRVELEVRASYARAEAAEEGIRAARVTMIHARQNLDLAQASFQRGLTTVVELADAEETFIFAQVSLFQSDFSFRLALANLERAAGRRYPLGR